MVIWSLLPFAISVSLTLNLISLIRHPLVFKDHGAAPEKSDLLGTMPGGGGGLPYKMDGDARRKF